ncbi:helix-hairpin-helix domain-containing protein [Undibacterium curvum]|uniref:helix-hairpin-helix domain-containing protein n=1 Tax=Undibacterium curvum TaxID=2762294 RepID=UPI003D09FE15
MHPSKVRREALHALTDLPNIAAAGASDLRLLGITHPQQLIGASALDLYQRLCLLSGQQQDPCVLDVLLSVVDFMNGAEAQPWWAYTSQRKQMLAALKSV